MRIIISIVFFCVIAFNLTGQEREREKERPFFKGSFQLPTTIANHSFKTLMSGVSDIEFSFNIPVSKSMHLGIFAQHSYLTFNDLSIPERTNATMQIVGTGVTLGYTVPTSDKFSLEFAVNGGYSYVLTSSETCLQSTGNRVYKKGGMSIKPDLSLFIRSSEYLSFGILFSYQFILSEFGPSNLCLSEFEGSFPTDYVGPSHLFAIGFGFKANIPPRR